jgi:1,4-dihydroxy-2-naphthoate octaprenyltransferase
MAKMKAFVGVARGPFLLLPVTLVAVGAAAAASVNQFSGFRSAVALIGLVALHAAVNALNEYSDFQRTGIDLNTERTPFSGGSGTLPAGDLTARGALIFGLGCAAVGLAIGLWFVAVVGPVMWPILVLGALSVLTYTDALARIGLGELFAGLGLGALPVAGAALVQEGHLPTAALAAAVPAFCMTFNLLLLNEFPDEAADRAGGRRNLVLIFGRRGAAWIYAAAALAVPASIGSAVAFGTLPPVALVAILPSLLLVKPLGWALSDPREPVPHPALGANVAWNLATNTVLAIALVASRWV